MLTVYRRGKPYTPKKFRDEATPPIFYLRPLPQDLIAEFAGAAAGNDAIEKASMGAKALYQTLCGWKNITDEEDNLVPFDREKVKEMVDDLEPTIRLEIINHVTRTSFLDETDRKNFDSASSSDAASSKDMTAPSAEGSQETKASASEPGRDALSP